MWRISFRHINKGREERAGLYMRVEFFSSTCKLFFMWRYEHFFLMDSETLRGKGTVDRIRLWWLLTRLKSLQDNSGSLWRNNTASLNDVSWAGTELHGRSQFVTMLMHHRFLRDLRAEGRRVCMCFWDSTALSSLELISMVWNTLRPGNLRHQWGDNHSWRSNELGHVISTEIKKEKKIA